MGIESAPGAGGTHVPGHVSLHQAGALARSFQPNGFEQAMSRLQEAPPPRSRTAALAAPVEGPHTPVQSSGAGSADRWDGLLNRLGRKYHVPPLFLKAVMLAESGGDPNAIGDSGHSVGLFQLHDRGYGHGMGDARFDPEVNAERATQGLAEAWHAGQRAGYTGEYAVRAAYDYSFNPGGGFAYQGDSVVRHYNRLLESQGLPPLS